MVSDREFGSMEYQSKTPISFHTSARIVSFMRMISLDPFSDFLEQRMRMRERLWILNFFALLAERPEREATWIVTIQGHFVSRRHQAISKGLTPQRLIPYLAFLKFTYILLVAAS